jgi:sulfhydrogenase subunit alpha
MSSEVRTIKVDYLARVEGEGALYLRVRDRKVEDVRLNIFESPRFFEAFLRGRKFSEAPDITARICGICPVAYQMSSVHALEAAVGVHLDGTIRALRRLLYCGEWIESHVLHIHMLHLPDFLGVDDAVQLARTHGDVVKRALRLKKLGNQLIEVVGGRPIHPVNVRVGGFYRAPAVEALTALLPELEWACDAARETLRLVATLPAPDIEHDYEFVSLRHPDEYPMNEGRIVSSRGIDIAAADWDSVFEESHVRHSNALHARVKARGAYLTGPLARYALNFDRLPAGIQAAARAAGLGPVVRNPFRSIAVRAVETLYACEEAMRLIRAYQAPDVGFQVVEPRDCAGGAATEAPRGLLFIRYAVDGEGLITSAQIVPPTSQNQASIEADLWQVAQAGIAEPDDVLRQRCEMAIRNHDPCISCATHFLDLTVDRG